MYYLVLLLWGISSSKKRSVCQQVTILKEFCQGPNQMMYSLPAGSFDEKRHGDYAGCARAELSEEVSNACSVCEAYTSFNRQCAWALSCE